ncbi:beta-xylosidase [Paraburkholderia sejongensis]|uniref:beta-xylosidase n=1 Tax=Paraburkholderia sejongensis TaxID=2886946 RepID=UPI001E471B28|nr:beta-xylosidase [Paraburkholderia sp. MMS20-SJTR3]
MSIATLAFAGAAMLTASAPGHAQIPQGGGTNSQENRVSEMGSKPASSTPELHESLKSQSKDSGQGNSRGKTAGQKQNSKGAGGFDNGLYGTGAGSNK